MVMVWDEVKRERWGRPGTARQPDGTSDTNYNSRASAWAQRTGHVPSLSWMLLWRFLIAAAVGRSADPEHPETDRAS